jgi:hypothetical protein
VHKGTAHKIRKGKATHADIWYLAKRLVLEVRWLLVLCYHKVDGNELVWDVKLFRNQGNAARAGGHRGSVKFECHEVKL